MRRYELRRRLDIVVDEQHEPSPRPSRARVARGSRTARILNENADWK
jgi:hypothetical protein